MKHSITPVLVITAMTATIGAIGAAQARAGVFYTFSTIDVPAAIRTNGSTVLQGISGDTLVGWYSDFTGSYGFGEIDGVLTAFLDPDVKSYSATFAFGIDGSTIVGNYRGSPDVNGFSVTGGLYTNIFVPGSTGTVANGIYGNTIVGAYNDGAMAGHGFSLTNGVYTTIDDPNAVPNGRGHLDRCLGQLSRLS